MKFKLHIIVLLILSSVNLVAADQTGERWVQTNSTPPGKISVLAIDPVTPTTIYAGTNAGVFKLIDGVNTWSAMNSGLTHRTVQALAINPANQSTIYAGTIGGIFKSLDGGDSWSPMNNGLPLDSSVLALAIDPATPATIYAGTVEGVFKSINGGTTWSAINSGLSPDSSVLTLVINPLAPAIIYAGTDDSGVFKSNDAGNSWNNMNCGPTGSVLSLVIDPLAPTTIYAGTWVGVIKSIDSGASWSAVNSGWSNGYVWALAIDPLSPATIYAGTDNGVFKTIDSGDSWIAVNSGLQSNSIVWALAIDRFTPATIYAATSDNGGVFITTDSAGSWNIMSSGLTNSDVAALAIDRFTPTTIYAGTSGGVFKSLDSGNSWSARNSGLCQISCNVLLLAIDPVNPATIYAATSDGLFKSTNAGDSWSAIDSDLNDGIYQLYAEAFVINPATPDVIYAATSGGVFKSINGGTSWSISGLSGDFPRLLAIDPLAPATIYAVAATGGFKSIDGGDTWNSMDYSLSYPNVLTLVIDPLTPATIYAGMDAGVYKTIDGGASWYESGMPNGTNVPALVIDPLVPATIFAGTEGGGGVLKSIDSGSSWNFMNDGLPNSVALYSNVQTLVIDPLNPAKVYAGIDQKGVFKFAPVITPAPSIDVSPTTFAGGTVTVGNSSTQQTITVSNSGSSDLVVSDIWSPVGFTVSLGSCPKLNPTLAPAESCTVVITFTPEYSGARSDQVSISSNDPANPTSFINVTGTGYDNRPPVTTIWNKPASISTLASGSFVFSSSGGGTFECSMDSASLSPCAEVIYEFSALGEGNHTFRVQATNPDGFKELTPVSYTWTIDTIPPVTSADIPGGSYASSQSVQLSCSDNTSGCSGTWYTTDGTVPTTASTPYTGAVNINQTTTLKYFSKDIATNSEAVQTVVYTILSGMNSLSLTVNGSGTVHSSPGTDLACTSSCNQSYTPGTVVTLTPTANGSSYFSAWSGCDSVNGNVCTVTMSTAKSVTATFNLHPLYTSTGTYSYTPGTLPQPLTGSFTSSDFLCDGTGIGPINITVTELTATSLIFQSSPEDISYFTRASGIPGDIVGIWSSTTSSGVYTLTLDSDGTISLSANISQCTDIWPPTINSVSPLSGMPGNLITINGNNFSPMLSDNTVLFNGTPAVVTGARHNQLFVLVPSGATSGTITVTHFGGTATSAQSFTPNVGTPPAILTWAGVTHKIESDGSEYDVLNAGMSSYATTLAGMSMSVSGPNGFNYTFTDADMDTYINGQMNVTKKYPTPDTPLEPGIYTFSLNDGNGNISHRVDTHVTVANNSMPRVDSATIQIQRKSETNESYRISWAPVNDTQTYFYRVRIYRNDAASTIVYDSARSSATYVDLGVGVLFDDSMYKLVIEAGDSLNYDLVTKRSNSAWKLFGPDSRDYDPNRLLVDYAILYNRFSPPEGALSTDVFLNVNNPAVVSSAQLLDATSAVVYTFDTIADMNPSGTDIFHVFNPPLTPGAYTIRFVANGVTHNAYATLTAPVSYPTPDSSTMQAEYLNNGDIRFSWASVDHTGALYYQVMVNDTTTGIMTTSARKNQTFVDMTVASLGSLENKRWRVEAYDSDTNYTQRNRSNSAYIPLVPVAYDAARPVINSYKVRNQINSDGVSATHLLINASDPDGNETITQQRVDGPGEYTRTLTIPDISGSGGYSLTEAGSPATGLYTFTVLDDTTKSAVRYKFQPAPHAIPSVDYHTFQIDPEPSGDLRISWAPVASDLRLWYYIEAYDSANNLTPVTFPSTAGTMMQQASVTVPASYMQEGVIFRIVAFDGSNGTTYNNVSRSVMVGYQPGLNYASLTDVDNDGYASNCDLNDADQAITSPVSGVCGSSHSKTFSSAPTNYLCARGTVSATPTGYGPWSWTCTGSSGGSDSTTCSARGIFSLSSPSNDFGNVALSISASSTFTLRNGTTSTVTTSAITLTGTDSAMFSVTLGTCATLTPTLASGASCTVNVAFTPTSSGGRSAILQVASDDPVYPLVTATLTGNGIIQDFALILDIQGEGTGSVAFSTGGSCTGFCANSYSSGTTVSLTPTVDPGSSFNIWTGCDSVNGNVCTVSMNGLKSVTAEYILMAAYVPPAMLPKTGQTTSYATGDDGDLEKGISWPATRFTNPDGSSPVSGTVVLDKLTGLEWPQDGGTPTAVGCTGGQMTWQGALDYVACLNANNYLNHTDWRLPNINELSSLVSREETNVSTFLNAQGFSNVQSSASAYWSSSTYAAYQEAYAWYVDMLNGSVYRGHKMLYFYVWPVRGGQSGSFGNSGISIPKTGQTTSFATGDDGDLEKGIAWPETRFTNPDGSSPVSGAVVLDKLTGLEWSQDGGTPTFTSCSGGQMTWQGALDYIACLNTNNYLNHTDWRFPNINELSSLVNREQFHSSTFLNAQGFSNVQSNYYWSSSTYAADTTIAWVVDMSYGYVGYNVMTDINYVWPVRGGQSGSFGSSVISVSPSSYSGGTITIGNFSSPETVTISNTGNASLVVSAVTVVTGDTTDFTVEPGTCPSLTPTLAPAESCTVLLSFIPTSSGLRNAVVRIASNDSVTPYSYLTLSGTGFDPPPSGTIIINGGATYTRTLAVTLTLSAYDNSGTVAEMQFSNNNSTWSDWEAYGTSKEWTLSIGSTARSVFVRYRDGAGNVSNPPSKDTIIYDGTPPVTILSGKPASLYNSASGTISFVSEAGSTFACRMDSADFSTCTSPYSFTALADSSHTFQVRATDPAGNSEATPASYSWTIDTTPPETSITAQPANPATLAPFGFSFSSEAGATFECRIDGGSYSTCTSPHSFPSLAEGSHTFQVRVKDLAGNFDTTPASYTWSIDTVAPDTSITGQPANSTIETTATFTFTSSDGTATFECKIDGGSFTACTTGINYTGLSVGSHTFEVKAKDTAGNYDQTPATYGWTINSASTDINIGGTYYSTLAAAVGAIAEGGELKLRSTVFSGDLILNRAASYSLIGGYDTNYASRNGTTAIQGTVIITAGTVTFDNIVIQ